jgi:hypothetical protein
MTTKPRTSPVQTLLREYAGRSSSKVQSPLLLRIDDRDPHDVYPGFCHIHLTLEPTDPPKFNLVLENVPYDAGMEALAEELHAAWRDTRMGRTLTLSIPLDEIAVIRRLAKAVRSVVGRGKHYAYSNWRWIARRITNSLNKLAAVLSR